MSDEVDVIAKGIAAALQRLLAGAHHDGRALVKATVEIKQVGDLVFVNADVQARSVGDTIVRSFASAGALDSPPTDSEAKEKRA